jgi:thiamine-phosphate pyrophosphorylase
LEHHVSTPTSLCLDFLLDDRAASSLTALTAAIEAAPIASVLFRAAVGNEPDAKIMRDLIAFPQKKGIAVLLAPNAGNAAKLDADGIHMPWSAAVVSEFKEIQRTARTGSILGGDAGRSRHDAMELGEAGADYVAFGIPPHVEDRDKASERQSDLIQWWSELFEVPCVAFDVPDPDAARHLASVGADFVAVCVRSTDMQADAAARVRAYSEAIRVPEPAK